jgi:chromosome segregation ATPase
MVEVSAAMERTLARLEAMYATLDVAAMMRLEAGQAAVQAEIAGLRTDFLSEIGNRSADIMGKVFELRTDITHIRDDIAVNMGAVDQVERINENTRSDMRQMREQMSVMWKQLKQAQEDIRTLKGEP